jgi:hypothetical protein
MNKRFILLLLTTLISTNVLAKPVPPATNKDGSIVSGFLTANFDPSAGVIPFPSNLLFLGTDDFTLNPPVANPNDYSDPAVALSAIDGFSTSEKWVTTFSSFPNQLDPTSVVPGQSVRLFEVSTVFGTIVIVSGVVRELTPGVDYVTAVSGNNLAILPLKPLKEMTTYMAVLTNDINDTVGNDATASGTYHLSQSDTPWVDENGNSTYPLIPNALAPTLESLRQITLSMEAAAASAGIPKDDIILSWTAQTESITPVLKNLRSIAKPAPTDFAPTGITTAEVGGFGLADLYMGVITVPYYLGVPSASNPVAPLTDFWKASPGAYVPPFDALGLNPKSTNVTVANPFPVVTDMQTVPLLVSVPNASSGMTRPAAGWPVVIFGHGLGGNRTNMLAAADTLARAGFAVVAMDTPLHGIVPALSPQLAPLYVGNSPWADIANERTFDVDYIDNATGAPGPDGITDPSGTHIINLGSMLTSRDNARQAQADLSVLAVSVPGMDINLDSLPDFDGSTVHYAGISMGAIMGTPFTAVEPMITTSFLSVPMGGIARGLAASPTFGPSIKAGLAAAGIVEGTASYEAFFTVFQTVTDSSDPINWGGEASLFKNVVLHEVIGDTVVPNVVPTAPLSGTEPLIRAMQLQSYSTTQSDAGGLDLAGRFVPPASHGSLLSPGTSPAATAEMQKQMALFLATVGTTVVVEDEATMVPVAQEEAETDEFELEVISETVTAKRAR